MQVRITETGLIEDLSIIDPASGLDWSGDCIGNAADPCIKYDAETEMHQCDQATYDWWSDYLARQQAADNRVHALIEQHGSEVINPIIQDAVGGLDIDDMPQAIHAALDAAFGEAGQG